MQLHKHPSFKGMSTDDCYSNVHLVTGKWSVSDWTKKDCRIVAALLDKFPESNQGTSFKILDSLYRKNPDTWKKMYYLFRDDSRMGLRGRFKAAAEGRICGLCNQVMCRSVVCNKCKTTVDGKRLLWSSRNVKSQKTLQSKYGEHVINVSQVKEIQDRKKENELARSGGQRTHPSQRSSFRQKTKLAWSLKSESEIKSIRDRAKATYQSKTGYLTTRQNPEAEAKRVNKIRAKWGTDNPFTSPKFRAHVNRVWLERYGYEEIFSSPEVQAKIRETHLRNNGTDNAMGNPEYLVKALKHKTISTEFDGKTYKVGSSSEVKAVPWLVSKYKTVYTQYDLGKYQEQYKWRPDFWIPSVKKYVEIKCVFTLLYGRDGTAFATNVKKAKSSPNVKWVVEHKGQLIPLPKDWWTRTPFQISRYIARKTIHLFSESVKQFLAELGCEVTDFKSYLRAKSNGRTLRILLRNVVTDSSWTPVKDTDFWSKSNTVILWDYAWYSRRRASRSMLRNRLGLLGKSIGARSCDLQSSTKLTKELKSFFGSTHVQGSPSSLSRHGIVYYLTHHEKIVAAMAFDRVVSNRGVVADKNYELVRYATSVRVNGGASKLFSAFVKQNEFESIVSYSDIQCFSGDLYPILGFKECGRSKPTYKAVWDSALSIVRSKQTVRLDQLNKFECFDPSLTERENCEVIGIRRVWDQGLIKWIYNFS